MRHKYTNRNEIQQLNVPIYNLESLTYALLKEDSSKMAWMIFKTVLAAAVISFTSWLANEQPRLAGFIMALPLSTMLALAFNYHEFQNSEKSMAFARSVFYAIPLSLLFFVPFLFASRLPFGFWAIYLSGVSLVLVGFLIHSLV